VWPWFVNLSHTFYYVIVGAGRRAGSVFGVVSDVAMLMCVLMCVFMCVFVWLLASASVCIQTWANMESRVRVCTGILRAVGGEGCEASATLTYLWTKGVSVVHEPRGPCSAADSLDAHGAPL